MTAGSTDVELWGGKDGHPVIEKDDAKFSFIKAACNPNTDVDPRELDTKQGMITELLYVPDDSPLPKVDEPPRRRRWPNTQEETSNKEEDEFHRLFSARQLPTRETWTQEPDCVRYLSFQANVES